MRAAKAWYLVYFSALSVLFPFLNLFMRRLGLSTRQIGIIGCARPLISFPAGSLWSGAADKTRRHRGVLLLTFAASVTLRLSIALVGRRGFLALLATVCMCEFFASPVTILVDAAVMAACTEQGEYGKQRLWGAIGWGAFSAVAGSLIQHTGIWAAFACHATLAAVALVPTLQVPFGPLHAKLDEQAGKLAGSWDAAGRNGGSSSSSSGGSGGSGNRGSSSKPAGQQDEEDGGRGVARFDSALEAQALLRHSKPGSDSKAGATFADSSTAGEPHGQQQQHGLQGQAQPAVHYWHGVWLLLSNAEAAIFLSMATIMGFGVGNIEGYLFLYLDSLGGTELLMGLSLTVTCAAESLVFYFLPQILRMGIRRCMHFVFAAFLLRMGCYTALQYAPSPWLVLPAEVMHGLTFALAWGGGSAYCAQLAPPGLEATTQGLFQGLYFGVGVGIGSLVGGAVFHHHGAQAVYIVACGVLAAGWLLCSLAQLAVRLLGMQNPTDKYLQVAAVEMSAAADLGESRA